MADGVLPQTSPAPYLTAIAEAELESRLIADLKSLGVRGYTICTVRGPASGKARTSKSKSS